MVFTIFIKFVAFLLTVALKIASTQSRNVVHNLSGDVFIVGRSNPQQFGAKTAKEAMLKYAHLFFFYRKTGMVEIAVQKIIDGFLQGFQIAFRE